MNYFEAIESMKQLFPDKEITTSFDDSCVRRIECSYTEGQPHKDCMVFMNKVRFDIPDVGVRYMSIKNHIVQSNSQQHQESAAKVGRYVEPEMLKAAKGLQEAAKLDASLQDEATAIVNKLYNEYNRTQADIDAKLAEVSVSNEDVQRVIAEKA